MSIGEGDWHLRVVGLVCLFCCAMPLMSMANGERLSIYGEITPGLAFYNDVGRLDGVVIDVVQALQAEVGSREPLQMVPWIRGYSYATREQAEPVMLFATAFNEERRHLFQWVGPILDVQWCFTVLNNSQLKIDNLEDAKKVNAIGVVKGDAREAMLRGLDFKNLMTVSADDLNVRLLQRGRTDIWFSSTITNSLFLKNEGLDENFIKHVFRLPSQGLFITFNLATPKVTVERWRKALVTLRDNGTMASILARYDQALPVSKIPDAH